MKDANYKFMNGAASRDSLEVPHPIQAGLSLVNQYFYSSTDIVVA